MYCIEQTREADLLPSFHAGAAGGVEQQVYLLKKAVSKHAFAYGAISQAGYS